MMPSWLEQNNIRLRSNDEHTFSIATNIFQYIFLSIFVGFKEAVFLFKRSNNKAVTHQIPFVLGCQRRVALPTQIKDVSRIDINSYLATLERSASFALLIRPYDNHCR